MRVRRHLVVLLCIAFTAACYLPWQNSPPQGEHRLGVAFQRQQTDYWCAITCVSMWVQFKGTPYPAEQQDIYDYIAWESPYWWTMGQGGSLSQEGMQFALWDYSGINTANEFYVAAESRKLVADIQKGISQGNPTIVVTGSGTHAKLVIGASWQQLGNYQPKVDVIITADPWDNGSRVDAVGYWLTSVGNGDAAASFYNTVHVSGQKFSALAELDEFDVWGGTYYGEPDPPNGCEQCTQMVEPNAQPLASLLRSLCSLFLWNRPAHATSANRRLDVAVPRPSQREVAQRGYRQPVGLGFKREHAVRREVFVPWPWANPRDHVFDNALAGLKQTDLAAVSGWEDLNQIIGHLHPSSIERVVSLSSNLEYWLLTLRLGGRPYAKALVSEDGWLLSAMRADDDDGQTETRRPEWAKDLVGQAGLRPKGVRLVHLESNLAPHLGSEDYNPLLEVTTEEDEPVYVTRDGRIFREDADGSRVGFTKRGIRAFSRVR